MGLTIGKFARVAGVGVETVRFYERRGLLEKPDREGGHYRLYSDAELARVRFIRRAQRLGFTLNEIGELLALDQVSATCDAVCDRTTAKIAAIEQKIADLTRMKHALRQLQDACPGDQPIAECTIMTCLQHEPAEDCAPDCACSTAA